MTANIDYASVKPEDLEVVREPKKSHFKVRHIPTGAVGEAPVLPVSLDRAKYHSIATLEPRYQQRGVTAWVGSANKDNPTVYLVSVRGGNEYLQALAQDVEALLWTFDPPKGKPGRPRKPKRPVSISGKTPLPEDFELDEKDEELIFKEMHKLGA